jgi:hypothetical protein
MKNFLCILALCSSGALQGTVITPGQINTPGGYTITVPGTYTLSDSVQVSAVTSGTVILINSDHVILDLGNNLIQQNGSAATICIDTTANRTNVTVKNGLLAGWSTGLRVAQGASATSLQSLTIADATYGINVVGTSNAVVTGLIINGINFIRNQTSVSASYADGATISNSNAQGGLSIVHCNGGTLTNFQESGYSALSASGLLMQDCLGWNVQNSTFSGNTATKWGANGAYVCGTTANSSGSHTFNGCSFSNNSGISIVRGLALISTASCLITNCVMNSNVAQSGYALGCIINNSVAGTTTIVSSTAQGNNVTGGDIYSEGIGFSLSTTGVLVKSCAAISNSAVYGSGIGFFMREDCYNNTFTLCNSINNSTHGYYNNAASTTIVQCSAIGQGGEDFAGIYTPTSVHLDCGCIGRDGSLTATSVHNVSWVTQR